MKTIAFNEFTLDNGLHCIVHENHRAPIVVVDLWYHVGSKNEDPSKTGFAHLFEHMMFQGSEHVGKTQHFSYVQSAGGTLNGSTSEDRTNYYETLPSNHLELGLWLEADRMRALSVNEENFENQRQVVMEERRMNYDNRPYGRVYEELHKRAFLDHPYRWIPIGSLKHIEQATLEDARAFYQTYYAPNNATLILAGDLKSNEAKELVEKYFGDIDRGPEFKRPDAGSLPLKESIYETLTDHIQLPGLFEAYRICEINHKDADPLSILSSLLSDGKSSRLYNSMVYESQLLKTVDTHAVPKEHPGLFLISAVGAPDVDFGMVREKITQEIKTIASEGISDRELEKAKNNYAMMLTQNFSSMMGVAENLAFFETYYGDAGEINQEIDRIERITKQDIQDVAHRYFVDQPSVTLEWIPEHTTG